MEKLSDRFMYYCGLLALNHNVVIEDLVHIDKLIYAEEKGLLLELPCKVGDTVWEIDVYTNSCMVECVVEKFGFDEIGELYCIYSAKDGLFTAKRYLGSFGDTVFTNIVEAEKKLAEIRGEQICRKTNIQN